jgi:acetolactate synthase-1/2/3 large subunit
MILCDVVTNFLINHNINVVFGIIGSANSRLYDSFSKNSIEIINVHNEQSAVIAAGAYYRTTGRIAVALVTAGGGASNAVTGVVSLWADSTPTIILSGQEQAMYVLEHKERRMYGTQGFDFPHMVSKTTKYAKTLCDATHIQNELELAYSIMMNGRKGPVLLDIPFDVQGANVEYRDWNKYIPEIINNGISIIPELLQKSKRPVILAGHGVKLSNSTELFKKCIEDIRVPVLLTWSGIDILPDDHPLYFGRPGVYGQRAANFIQQKSDLLIVLGSRLTLPQSGYNFDEFARNATIVMVDVDKTENKKFVDIFIHTDCNEFLQQISRLSYENQEWLNTCREIFTKFPLVEDAHIDDGYPNSYKIIDKMSNYLKNDQIIVTDMGTALLSGHQAIRLKKDQTMFSSYGLGEMGYGLPAALGAAISSKDREVLCLNCDGSMMMNLQELQTIIQHNLRVKIVIFNNDGYLMIKHTQNMLFNGKYTAVDKSSGIVLPNYMKLADAFGYNKYEIHSWDEFDNTFQEFMNVDRPSICEIHMHPKQDFIPKVKGVYNNNTNKIFAPPLEEMSPLLPFHVIQDVMGEDISTHSAGFSRI